MKGASWALVLALLVAGCEQKPRPPIRIEPTKPYRPPEAGSPPMDEAKVVAGAKAGRETDCRQDGELEWSNLPAGRQRAGLELTAAVARGDGPAVERLLARGADPGFRDEFGRGPLGMAARCDQAGILRRLLKAGAPLERRYVFQVGALVYRQTALMIAAQNGSEEAVVALLVAGADPDLEQLGKYEYERRFRPTGPSLSLAKTNAVARLLLAAGADPNQGATTPLMDAARSPNPDRIVMLLRYGADPNRRDSGGETALDYCLQSSARSAEVAQVLRAAMAQKRP